MSLFQEKYITVCYSCCFGFRLANLFQKVYVQEKRPYLTLVFNTCLCNMHFRLFVYAICIFDYMLYAIFRLCNMHDCGGEQSLGFAGGKIPGLTFLMLLRNLSSCFGFLLTRGRLFCCGWVGSGG